MKDFSKHRDKRTAWPFSFFYLTRHALVWFFYFQAERQNLACVFGSFSKQMCRMKFSTANSHQVSVVNLLQRYHFNHILVSSKEIQSSWARMRRQTLPLARFTLSNRNRTLQVFKKMHELFQRILPMWGIHKVDLSKQLINFWKTLIIIRIRIFP